MTQLDHVSPLIQWLPIAFRIVSKLPNTVFKVLHDHQAPASPMCVCDENFWNLLC